MLGSWPLWTRRPVWNTSPMSTPCHWRASLVSFICSGFIKTRNQAIVIASRFDVETYENCNSLKFAVFFDSQAYQASKILSNIPRFQPPFCPSKNLAGFYEAGQMPWDESLLPAMWFSGHILGQPQQTKLGFFFPGRIVIVCTVWSLIGILMGFRINYASWLCGW